MADFAERDLLVALLDHTRGEPAARGNLRAAVRVTSEMFNHFLGQLRSEGLISERGGLIETSPGQRLKIAVRAVELGADIERVSRTLGWLEFEEMTAYVFEENGYTVRRRYRFKAEGRRWEVDVLASRRPLVVCVECKRWARGMGDAAAKRTVETHLEKTRVFSENLVKAAEELGLRGWRRAVVVPVTMSLTPAPMRFYSHIPVVSILEFPSFLGDFEGHLNSLTYFEVGLPPPRTKPSQTVLRREHVQPKSENMKGIPDTTFSITARCPATGDLGVAISTAVPAVGQRCPHVKLGVGAIATQSYTNVMLGINGLKLLKLGLTSERALSTLLEEDEGRDLRQVAAVDSRGRCFGYTGSKCVEWAGHIVGEGLVAAGNMLVGRETIEAMAGAFRGSKGDLSERLLVALEAGQVAGGDKRGRVSAALLVASREPKRYHDLRVDDHPDPVAELRRIYDKVAAMVRERERI